MKHIENRVLDNRVLGNRISIPDGRTRRGSVGWFQSSLLAGVALVMGWGNHPAIATGGPASPLLIDDFSSGSAQFQIGITDDPVFTAQSGTMLGGERDMLLFLGYGQPNQTWDVSLASPQGLFWKNGPGMHVGSMILEWDGAGDRSIIYDPVNNPPTQPLTLDLTAYNTFRWHFESNSQPTQVQLYAGNVDWTAGKALGFSGSPLSILAGGQQSNFVFDIPLSSFSQDEINPTLKPVDWSQVNVLLAIIASDVGVTGNELGITRFEAVHVSESRGALSLLGLVGCCLWIGKRYR